MGMKVVEAYYTPGQVALLLNFSTAWVVERVLAGEFGRCVRIGSGRQADYRIPASGVNAWLERNQLPAVCEPVLARTEGELRRKSKRLDND